MNLMQWVGNVVIGVDQCGSAVCRGSTCLTLSARAATGRRDGRRAWIVLCWFLERIDHGHIPRAVDNNRARLRAALKELEGL
jgi:hypothetical protein